MKRYAAIVLVTVMPVQLLLTVAYSQRPYEYVGADKCRQCHSSSGGMTQYEIWISSPHAGAFTVLKGEKAVKISGRAGIKKPWKNRTCLKCHTTGGGRSPLTAEEGVGCEACHGPGSGYFRGEYHINYQDRRNGYITAKKYGMYPILGYEQNLMKREKLCRYCHNKARPCLPGDKKGIRSKGLSIQVIDTLRKGDLNLSHKLRRY